MVIILVLCHIQKKLHDSVLALFIYLSQRYKTIVLLHVLNSLDLWPNTKLDAPNGADATCIYKAHLLLVLLAPYQGVLHISRKNFKYKFG
jgi:hypothetical protein